MGDSPLGLIVRNQAFPPFSVVSFIKVVHGDAESIECRAFTSDVIIKCEIKAHSLLCIRAAAIRRRLQVHLEEVSPQAIPPVGVLDVLGGTGSECYL